MSNREPKSCNKWGINKLKPFHCAPIYFIITFKINVTGKCLYFRNSSSPPAHIHTNGTQINIHRCLLGLGWFIGSTAVLLRTTQRSAFLSDSCNILCAHTHTGGHRRAGCEARFTFRPWKCVWKYIERTAWIVSGPVPLDALYCLCFMNDLLQCNEIWHVIFPNLLPLRCDI